MECWNIGFKKDFNHFNFIVNPAGGGTINPTLPSPLRAGVPRAEASTHYSLRGVGATLRAGGRYSIIPIVSEAN
jgi:hypothetical protein